MCRGKHSGNRRCPGCVGPTAMAKHNERRRNNRAIRRNGAEWAEQNGVDPDVVEAMREASPKVAKEWLKANGVNPDDFVDGVPQVDVKPALGAGPAVAQPNVGPPSPLPPVKGAAAPGGGGPAGGGAGGAAGQVPSVGQQHSGPPWASEAWCTPELRQQISAVQDLQGGHRDERSLLTGQPTAIVPLSSRRARGMAPKGGTNQTVRMTLDNGMTGYFKPVAGERRDLASGFGQDSHQQGVHEAAAWRLASQMGAPWSEIVPPVVMREVNGVVGSFALERPGRTSNRSPWHTGEWREAAFFDCLIGQQDRHAGNYLVAGDRINLIDHGYAFAKPGDYRNFSWLSDERVTTDPALTYSERDALQRLVSSPDLMGMSKILQPERAEALRRRAEGMLASGRLNDRY